MCCDSRQITPLCVCVVGGGGGIAAFFFTLVPAGPELLQLNEAGPVRGFTQWFLGCETSADSSCPSCPQPTLPTSGHFPSLLGASPCSYRLQLFGFICPGVNLAVLTAILLGFLICQLCGWLFLPFLSGNNKAWVVAVGFSFLTLAATAAACSLSFSLLTSWYVGIFHNL